MKTARLNFAAMFMLMVVTLLVGCAQLGVPAPQTFKEKLLVGYTTVASVRDTATNLLSAGKINVKDAENVQAQADTARAGLDVARQMEAQGQTGPAADKLSAMILALGAVQSYLVARGGQ